MVQKDLQNQKLIGNLELEKAQNKELIEKQSKKINKLKNQSLILVTFFKNLGLKISDFKKVFQKPKATTKKLYN